MSQVLDYTSRVSDPASRKFETFSYLPAMSDADIRIRSAFERVFGPTVAEADCRPESA